MDIPKAAITAAASAIERELMSGRDYSMAADSDEALARVALEAAAPILAEAVAESLRAALGSITSCITTSARDASEYRVDAWVYGIAVGWDCEDDHEHDDICGGTGAMAEVAARHGWDEVAVARLRTLRKAYAAATSPPAGEARG